MTVRKDRAQSVWAEGIAEDVAKYEDWLARDENKMVTRVAKSEQSVTKVSVTKSE